MAHGGRRTVNRPPKLWYNDDADDRLRELLVMNQVSFRDQLGKAVELAGSQLEFLKPMVMAPGIYMGAAAAVQRGTIVIVLADTERVFTMYLRPDPGLPVTLGDTIDHLVGQLGQMLGHSVSNHLAMDAMRNALDSWGGAPASDNPRIGEQEGLSLLGMLFGSMPALERRRMTDSLERVANQDVCPAMIGLVGPASNGKPDMYCAAWPLLLPLAPYVDSPRVAGAPAH